MVSYLSGLQVLGLKLNLIWKITSVGAENLYLINPQIISS